MFFQKLVVVLSMLPGSAADCAGGQCEVPGENMLQVHSARGEEGNEETDAALMDMTDEMLEKEDFQDVRDADMVEMEMDESEAELEEDGVLARTGKGKSTGSIACYPAVNFKGPMNIKVCYDTTWDDAKTKRRAVISWNWGSQSLIGYKHFVSLGYVGIEMDGPNANCNYKVPDLIKWLNGAKFGDYFKQLKPSFDIDGKKVFVAGYSRQGICAANSANTGSRGMIGVITMGAFKWVSHGKFDKKTPPFLSFSCGDGTQSTKDQDYEKKIPNTIGTIQGKMGSDRFIDVNWPDCNHLTYTKKSSEIKEQIAPWMDRIVKGTISS